MKLISRVSIAAKVFHCDYALIDLTPHLAWLALARVARLKEHKATGSALLKMHF